jgi:hypothetical protein
MSFIKLKSVTAYEEAVKSGHGTHLEWAPEKQEKKRAKVSEAVLPEGQKPRLRPPDVATFPKQGIPFSQRELLNVITRSGLGPQRLQDILCFIYWKYSKTLSHFVGNWEKWLKNDTKSSSATGGEKRDT